MLSTIVQIHHCDESPVIEDNNPKTDNIINSLLINHHQSQPTMGNILLASNLPILITALGKLLHKTIGDDLKLQSVDSFKDVKAVLDDGSIEMLILDFNIVDAEDYFAFKFLPKRHTDLKILVLCEETNVRFYSELYRNGVRGIIRMESSIAEISNSLAKVYGGELYVESGILFGLLNPNIVTDAKKNTKATVTAFQNLTAKKKQVAELLVKGKANIEICKLLGLHPSTVSSYKRSIFTKLNVSNLLELESLRKELKNGR